MSKEESRCPVGDLVKKGPIGFSPATVYLAGPIGQVTYDEFKGWRTIASKRLAAKDIEIEDPTDRLGTDPFVVVNGDKRAIRRSGLVLAYAPKGVAFVGTSMEIFFAHEILNLPVVVWGELHGTRPSPWIVMHSDYVYETLDEALAIILGE